MKTIADRIGLGLESNLKVGISQGLTHAYKLSQEYDLHTHKGLLLFQTALVTEALRQSTEGVRLSLEAATTHD